MKYEPQIFEVGKEYPTPFGNLIEIISMEKDRASIKVFDKWRINNDFERHKKVEVLISVAQIYYYIEQRLSIINSKFAITTSHSKELSWGFSSSYQGDSESINNFYKKPFWIHFTGHSPKKLQIEIDRIKSMPYVKDSIIPHTIDNIITYPAGNLSYLLVKEYINEENIEEIMDILLKIKF